MSFLKWKEFLKYSNLQSSIFNSNLPRCGRKNMNQRLALIAIGGNSLIKSKELQKVEDQHQAISETVRHVADLIVQGYQVLISHGNGPQVGFIMRRSEVARQVTGLHLVPLVNVVADTQGSNRLSDSAVLEQRTGQPQYTRAVCHGDHPGRGGPERSRV